MLLNLSMSSLSNLSSGSSGLSSIENIVNVIVTALRVIAVSVFIGGSIYVAIQYWTTNPKAEEHRNSLVKGIIILLIFSELIFPLIKNALSSFN